MGRHKLFCAVKIFSLLLVFMWNVDCGHATNTQVSPKLVLPAKVLRVLPGYRFWCSATGTEPIYIALIRNSRVLANTTLFWNADVVVNEEANYTFVATNKYGSDVGVVSVIFKDCDVVCSYEWIYPWGNVLSCRNVTTPGDIAKCSSTFIESLRVISSNFTHVPVGIFSNLTGLRMLDLSSNAITFLPDKVFKNLTNLLELSLTSNAISFLTDSVFESLTNLQELSLASNGISFLTDRVFANLTHLQYLYLSSNTITFLPDRVFANLKNLRTLSLSSNVITFLPDGLLANLKKLQYLDLSSNAITFLPDKLFENLIHLGELNLSSNAITFLPDRVFANLRILRVLDLSSNAVTSLPDRVFANLRRLTSLTASFHVSIEPYNHTTSMAEQHFSLFLGEDCHLTLFTLEKYHPLDRIITIFVINAITFLPDRVFADLSNLGILYLSSNAIRILPDKVFANVQYLTYIELSSNSITFLPERVFANLRILSEVDLSYNKIQYLPNDMFCCSSQFQYLSLHSNMITSISKETFAEATDLAYLFLSANKLDNIPYRTFSNVYLGFSQESILMFSDNPITTIQPEAFRWDYHGGMHVYLLRTKLKTLSLDSFIHHRVHDYRMLMVNRTIAKLTYVTVLMKKNITIYLSVDLNERTSFRGVHRMYFCLKN
ncbi:uncharacterized protein LOC144659298 [Oculina patagonica]